MHKLCGTYPAYLAIMLVSILIRAIVPDEFSHAEFHMVRKTQTNKLNNYDFLTAEVNVAVIRWSVWIICEAVRSIRLARWISAVIHGESHTAVWKHVAGKVVTIPTPSNARQATLCGAPKFLHIPFLVGFVLQVVGPASKPSGKLDNI